MATEYYDARETGLRVWFILFVDFFFNATLVCTIVCVRQPVRGFDGYYLRRTTSWKSFFFFLFFIVCYVIITNRFVLKLMSPRRAGAGKGCSEREGDGPDGIISRIIMEIGRRCGRQKNRSGDVSETAAAAAAAFVRDQRLLWRHRNIPRVILSLLFCVSCDP